MVSDALKLHMDPSSVERQAYKNRAMLSHLLRMRREKRKQCDSDELYKLAADMHPAVSKGTHRPACASPGQGASRQTIKQTGASKCC